MHVVHDYQTRVLDQEPDAIAICPTPCQEYIVVGTYSLTNDKAAETDVVPGRRGSLQILPFSPSATSSGQTPGCLVREDFDFGVYDLRFHERYEGLLGVAASDGRVMFFRLCGRNGKVLANAGDRLELRLVGWVMVEEGSIITQFTFLSDAVEREGDQEVVTLAATTQSGCVRVVRVTVPHASSVQLDAMRTDHSPSKNGELDGEVGTLHSHADGFEAWTVSAIPIDSSDQVLLVSGGDDSRLVASTLDLDSFSQRNGAHHHDEDEDKDEDDEDENILLGMPVFTDRRTHEAGVVSLLHLGRLRELTTGEQAAEQAERLELLLTGSYDEYIRLFSFPAAAGPGTKPRLRAEMKMPGGVWRITLLDEYCTNAVGDKTNDSSSVTREYVLLVAGHLGGAFIARLTQRLVNSDEDGDEWKFDIEAEFTKGHESLVYACVARRHGGGREITEWEVISSSFYDRKVCNWRWVDSKSAGVS